MAKRSDHNTLRFIATGFDLVGGSTVIIIPATARKWRTTRIDIHYKTVTGFVSVASASFGSNSSSFNNIMSIAALGTTAVIDGTVPQSSLVLLDQVADLTSSGLQMKVTTPAVSTALTADIHVTGHFVEP